MNAFKIQQFRPIPPIKQKYSQPKCAPKFTIKATQINYQNYPIDSLMMIIDEHFSEQAPAANLVVKALKVISISLKDKQLKDNFEKIVMRNSENKQKMYTLISYWLSFLNSDKMMKILQKFSQKIQLIFTCSLFCIHMFSESSYKYNKEIGRLIDLYIKQKVRDQEDINNFLVHTKDWFLSVQFNIMNFIYKINRLKFQGQNSQKFIKNLLNWIFKHEKTQQSLKLSLQIFIKNLITKQSHQFQQTDTFFDRFSFLSDIFILNFQTQLLVSDIVQLWKRINSTQELNLKTVNLCRSAIRQYLNSDKSGIKYWQILEKFYTSENSNQHKQQIIYLGAQLEYEGMLAEFIAKKYLFSYFSGKNFEIQKQNVLMNQVRDSCASGKIKIANNFIESLSQMIRGIQNCSSKGGVNIISVNKIHAVKNWPIINIFQASSNQRVKKLTRILPQADEYMKKLKKVFEKITEKAEKKMQKVQIAYNVLIVTDKETSRDYCLTIQQIISNQNLFKYLLSQNNQQCYKKMYLPPIQSGIEITDKKQKSRQDYHPIVLDAITIKALKKHKKGLNLEELSSYMKLNQQKVSAVLQRLQQKGYVEQNQDNKFCYLP